MGALAPAGVLSSPTYSVLKHRSETAFLTPIDCVARYLQQLIRFVAVAKTGSAVLLLSDASCTVFKQHLMNMKAAVTFPGVVPQCVDIHCASSPVCRKRNTGDQSQHVLLMQPER